jgi:hypothetical protein
MICGAIFQAGEPHESHKPYIDAEQQAIIESMEEAMTPVDGIVGGPLYAIVRNENSIWGFFDTYDQALDVLSRVVFRSFRIVAL